MDRIAAARPARLLALRCPHGPEGFVAFGTTVSAFWNLTLNSWMQTPDGYKSVDVATPRLASLKLTRDQDGEIRSIIEFGDRHPPMAPVFRSFRVMVRMGVLMLVVSWADWRLSRRAQWQAARIPRPFLWVLSGITSSGWLASPSSPAAYAPLGEAWLAMKTEGALQLTAISWDKLAWAPVVIGMVLIAVPVLGFIGLACSIYPFGVIDRLTIWQAASRTADLKVILIGV